MLRRHICVVYIVQSIKQVDDCEFDCNGEFHDAFSPSRSSSGLVKLDEATPSCVHFNVPSMLKLIRLSSASNHKPWTLALDAYCEQTNAAIGRMEAKKHKTTPIKTIWRYKWPITKRKPSIAFTRASLQHKTFGFSNSKVKPLVRINTCTIHICESNTRGNALDAFTNTIEFGPHELPRSCQRNAMRKSSTMAFIIDWFQPILTMIFDSGRKQWYQKSADDSSRFRPKRAAPKRMENILHVQFILFHTMHASSMWPMNKWMSHRRCHINHRQWISFGASSWNHFLLINEPNSTRR